MRNKSMQNKSKYFFCCLLSVLIVGCAGGMDVDYKKSPVEGIIGGNKVDANSDLGRSVVMIRSKVATVQNDKTISVSYNICTGSVVAENVILTVAHCIVGAAKDMEIVYTSDLHDEKSRVSPVETVLKHKTYEAINDYDLSTGHVDDDIALVKIKGVVPSDYKIMTIAEFGSLTEKFNIVSIGYGRNTGALNLPADTDLGAGVLRAASVEGTSYVPEFNFFLSNQKSGKGVCYGDSGGPALIQENGEFKILGLTKAIFARASDQVNQKFDVDNCKFNGLFMNLQFYQQWILESIQSLSSAPILAKR